MGKFEQKSKKNLAVEEVNAAAVTEDVTLDDVIAEFKEPEVTEEPKTPEVTEEPKKAKKTKKEKKAEKAEKTDKPEKIKKQRRFRWWHIPLTLIVLILVAVIGLMGFMLTMLPPQNLVAATSNFQLELSDKMMDFALSGDRDYSTIPDALTMADGTPVTTAEEFEARRAEILSLFEENVYGVMPKNGYLTTFEVMEEHSILNGTALRKQIKITVSTGGGSSDAMMLLYIPKLEAGNLAPAIIGLNFNGNHTVLNDANIIPSCATDTTDGTWTEMTGTKEERWNIRNCLERGYAVATIYANDFAPDNAETYRSRVISLFPEPEFKAVGAWAFGLSRGVDYLIKDPAIDSSRIAVVGHSRLGKAATWAGANDERIALVISNDSGNSGASLSRGNHGETVKSINAVFPHWFCSKYAEYSKNENALPVDQNLLLAVIAPRKVYVASAAGDLWADPQGAWNSLMHATNAYELYDLEVIPYADAQPAVDTPVWTSAMGYHVRSGWHNINKVDWEHYLNYMDTYLVN